MRHYWDFFGPRAEPTAAHFLEHLTGFARQHGLAVGGVGLESSGPGHAAVYCDAEGAASSAVERSLRPRRSARTGDEHAEPRD